MNKTIPIYLTHLGLDISKDKIDCALLINNKFKHKVISNDDNGFQNLLNWLQQQQVNLTELHACCEATNIYYLSIANFLHLRKISISVINPSIIKSYAQFKLKRIKTDKQDAKLIANYCFSENPELWQPESEDKRKLRSLYRRTEQLNTLLTMEKNRLYVADGYAINSISEVIELLEKQLIECRKQMQDLINSNAKLKHQQRILKTIPGIGETTSQMLLSVLIDMDKFPTVKHLISWLGLSPVIRQSGKYQGQSKLSKMGDKTIRKALYIPARVACTRSKLWRSWFDEKVKTKPPKKVYVLMMVKIVKYAYFCLKTDTVFKSVIHKKAA